MSEKGHHPKLSREERLAQQLRANLSRRKQAGRKAKAKAAEDTETARPKPDAPSP